MTHMIAIRDTRSRPERRLHRCLLHMAGPSARIAAASSAPWASALFAGTRHCIALDMDSAGAAVLARALPDAEFHVPGHIVADISVDSKERGFGMDGAPRTLLHLSALTIEAW